MKKGAKRSPEESRLLDLLATLIEAFEEKNYPIAEGSDPRVALRELMREHDLKQTDILDVFGSQGVVSQVLNGNARSPKPKPAASPTVSACP